MKMCNSEAMKLIKELENRKELILFAEGKRSKTSYKEGEEKRLTKYNYDDTRNEIADIDAQIRKVKHSLAIANCTVRIDGFDITIGEALIYLAQLNAEYGRLDVLGGCEKLSRRITNNGVVEFTECLYEPDRAMEEQKKVYSTICKLQVAIDKANLTNIIEI